MKKPFQLLGGSTAGQQNDENLSKISFGQPKVPTRITVKGDVTAGKKLIGFGRRKLAQLANYMSFSNIVTASKIWSSGDRKIVVSISYGLSTVSIYVPAGIPLKEIEAMCQCCGDCLMVGRIARRSDNEYWDVDVEICQTGTEDYVFTLFENVPFIDQNTQSVPGDLVLVMIPPNIKHTATTDFPDVIYYFAETTGKTWQMFNCMNKNDIGNSEVDLTENMIDSAAYTPRGSSCHNAMANIPIDQEDPPTTVPSYIFALSITMGDCMVPK